MIFSTIQNRVICEKPINMIYQFVVKREKEIERQRVWDRESEREREERVREDRDAETKRDRRSINSIPVYHQK